MANRVAAARGALGPTVARQRALTVLSLMRTEGRSLTRAARDAGTTPRTVRRYVGSAVQKKDDGRYRATLADRLTRTMSVLTRGGIRELKVRGSRSASTVGAHWPAVQHFLATGDTDHLSEFATVRVAGHALETDPAALERLGRRGELSIDDIYPKR